MQHTYLSASQKHYAVIVFAIAWLVQPSIAAAGAPLDALQATSQKVHAVLNVDAFDKPLSASSFALVMQATMPRQGSCQQGIRLLSSGRRKGNAVTPRLPPQL